MNTRDEGEKDRLARIDAENEAAIQAWRAQREASRSIEYSTNDAYRLIDEDFLKAHDTVLEFCFTTAEMTDEVEEAADRMFDIAIQNSDADMLKFCLARYDDFVRQRRTPPWTMMEHINDAFRRFRSTAGTSLDAAFCLPKSGRGRPPSFSERLSNRTASDFIAYLVAEKGLSENKAIAQAEDFHKRGDLRDVWRKFRRTVKGE